MENYKVIIVDDEYEVRQGIIDCVKWEKYGFTVIKDASNGEDALEMADLLRPDLIITDIKMPYMDGLELTKQLALLLPTTKVVIITGFDDFKYAKTAINLNVMDYIIKPINLEELTTILIDIKNKMDKEKQAREDIKFLSEHYYNSIPILRDSFLLSLLEGRAFSNDIIKQASIYDVTLATDYFAVACIKISLKDLNEESQIKNFSIKRVAEEILQKYIKYYAIMYLDYIVIIGCLNTQDMLNEFMLGLNEFYQLIEKQFKIKLSIGIGYIVNNPELLYKSFGGAQIAIDYRIILDEEKPIFIGDIEPNMDVEIRFDEKYEIMLQRSIRQADDEQIKSTIYMLIDICSDINLPYQKYKTYLLEIVNSISALCESFDIEIEQVFGENFYPMEKLTSFESKKEITEWIVDVCLMLSSIIKKDRQKNSEKIVDDAKHFAKENFDKFDFSIEEMCKSFNVSPAYFSSLFKKEVGKTFINYLTDIRMNEAKKLLIESDLKTYLVAEKSGYVDANYFSFAFKKYFGVSPTKFRSGTVE